jgi:hypothetical protein
MTAEGASAGRLQGKVLLASTGWRQGEILMDFPSGPDQALW